MEVRLREWSKESVELYVEGAPHHLLNAVRRYSMVKTPTFAIDEVIVVVNTSAMFDEILAHRLGLIPLRTEEVVDKIEGLDVTLCEKCSAEGEERPPKELCDTCYVRLFLDVEAHDSEVVVYSRDIVSEDPLVKPVYDNIPIVILAPGQRISLELRARLGRGLEHAKWSPVTVAVSRAVARININAKECNTCGKCVEVCPKRILRVEGGGIVVSDLLECTICKQCVMACPLKAIEVEPEADKAVLRVESVGSLEPETVLKLAIRMLERDLEHLQKVFERMRGGGQR